MREMRTTPEQVYQNANNAQVLFIWTFQDFELLFQQKCNFTFKFTIICDKRLLNYDVTTLLESTTSCVEFILHILEIFKNGFLMVI